MRDLIWLGLSPFAQEQQVLERNSVDGKGDPPEQLSAYSLFQVSHECISNDLSLRRGVKPVQQADQVLSNFSRRGGILFQPSNHALPDFRPDLEHWQQQAKQLSREKRVLDGQSCFPERGQRSYDRKVLQQTIRKQAIESRLAEFGQGIWKRRFADRVED